MVDVDPIRRRRGKFVPVERGVDPAMTDHVCAWAAASPARYRASSSSKAASMSSRSNTTCADDPLVGVDLGDAEHLGAELASAAGRGSTERIRARARRSPRVAMTVDVMFADARRRRSLACLRSRHLDRAEPRRSRRDGDRPTKMSSASISAMASQSRAAKYAKKRSTYLACRVFQPRAPAVAAPRIARARRRGLPRRRFRSG